VMLEALAHAVGVDLPPGLAGSLLLRPEEWTELRALGHRLGAHGMTHARLSGLSAEDLEAEVVASIRHVRAIEPRVAFAYPDGAHDEPSRAAVCAAGARSAVTCEHGVVTTRACRFRLPRLFARPPRGPRPSAS
jgi:peptidoglycan/xylan/chitin deacetylase (PgdA/CDA1 family)